MSRFVALLLLMVMITSTGYSQTPATAFEMNTRLGRGINMGNAFEAPTETAWGNPWKPEYFRIMSELGFSHVRIPIRWSTPERSMDEPPYTIYPAFLNRIKEVVDTALKYHLHPIINMHHHESLFDDPEGQKARFLAQWEQIAGFFSDYPDSLLFEVLNEPHNNLTPEKWNVFFVDALARIRITNPTRVVLMGTAEWGGLGGVSKLVIPDDPYLILTVHYYNPFEFTHQGAEWVGGSDTWLGTRWYDTEAERQTVMDEFSYAIQFAAEKNIPLHVGEFGAYSKAGMDSRVRWTTFLARWFDEQGFSWAYWEFSAGFGIYNPSTWQVISALANALLINPMPEPAAVEIELLLENDFEDGVQGWNLYTSGGAVADLTAGSGRLNVNITGGGTSTWHVQLVKSGLSIEKGSMYRVSFNAHAASGSRTISTYTGKASDPWTAYSGYKSYTVSDSENDYSYSFVMSNETDQNARLVFDLGTSEVDFFLSHIRVDKINILLSKTPDEKPPVLYYPNPVTGILRIENIPLYRELCIYNLHGQMLKKYPLVSELLDIDFHEMPAGLYLISLSDFLQRTCFFISKI